MPKDVSEYLRRLKTALRGADPATVQDALADAEEHLTEAMERASRERHAEGPGKLFAEIIEEYGSPEEVAMAYKEIETRVPPAFGPRRHAHPRSGASRFFGVIAEPRAYAALIYMFLSLVTGVFYFTWSVTGISLSAGLIVLVIGLPFLTLFLISVRGLALVEGRLVEAVLGVRMPRRPVFLAKNMGWWQRVKMVFRDRATWTAFLYMILLMPLGIIYFTVFVSLIAVSLAAIASPILQYGFHFPIVQNGSYRYYLPAWTAPLVVAFGFVLLIITLHLAKALGGAHARLAKVLLVKGERPDSPG